MIRLEFLDIEGWRDGEKTERDIILPYFDTSISVGVYTEEESKKTFSLKRKMNYLQLDVLFYVKEEVYFEQNTILWNWVKYMHKKLLHKQTDTTLKDFEKWRSGVGLNDQQH